MSDGPRDVSTELERLRRENAALDEQLKLLVLTEQRLYRSQNALDAQIGIVRALARFALESSVSEQPEATLARAADLVDREFSVDWVGFVHPGHAPEDVVVIGSLHTDAAPAAPVRVDPESRAWLDTLSEAEWCERDRDAPQPPWRLLAAVAPEVREGFAHEGTATLASVPLRGAGGYAPGALLVASLRPRPAAIRAGGLSEDHLPYLELLANHVDHALANIGLTRRLRERSAELAQSLQHLERTQQELLQSQKLEAIGRLAGGVAHDFNNLLTVIMGYAGTLATQLSRQSPAHENVARIKDAAQRAANLTRQLLALGRRQVQRREAVDLGEQCAHTADLLRRLVGEDIRFELEAEPGLRPVSVDRTHLEQVLLNLIVNARDAMPGGGELHLTARAAGAADLERCDPAADAAGFAALDVVDDGVGMDAATMARAFEPFFSTKPPGQGSGLGLAVVYGIVKQGDGHVYVESAPGRGTRFTVLLPVVAGPAGPSADARPGDSAVAPRPGLRVLVVEDEPGIREVVSGSLTRAGYVVRQASDGLEALAHIAEGAPDLVLTDVLMPRMGGQALAAEVERRHPGVRVAFMSGYAEDLWGADTAVARSEAFLAKPFTSEELRHFVARILARDAAAPPRA